MNKKWNYYNDSDPRACEWARRLIKTGAVPDGEVDCRSISDVHAEDIVGFRQCHFFCGILGWSLALRLAGIPDEYPIWTGSCPCQPYSAAGKGEGDKDERNLWPEFFRLIKECRPVAVAGEQVAAAIRHGWLDGISADLEREGYSVGAAVLGAHSVGAPHIRQRLYWVADSGDSERRWRSTAGRNAGFSLHAADGSANCRVADAGGSERREERASDISGPGRGDAAPGVDAESGCLADSAPWSDFDVIHCRDGKARRVGRGVFTMADGLPASLGRVQPDVVRLVINEVNRHAEITETTCSEVLYDLWLLNESKTIQRTPGRCVGIHSAEILLSFLRQLAEQGRAIVDAVPRESQQIDWNDLRMLFSNDATSLASYRRKLSEQQSREYSDSLRQLSSFVARTASSSWIEAFNENAVRLSPLTAAVPKRGSTSGERRSFRAARSNRTGRLKGYGNAIVPQVAAEFVMAWMEGF